MNRLHKVVETGPSGEITGRVAYVLRPTTLPAPRPGFEWRKDETFNAADSILADSALKAVFAAAIRDGHALVPPVDN